MREFETGATRDSDDGKLDFEGFLSPAVLERFAQYMHKHRVQADGNVRDSDNWQKGIPREAYMKSLWRHFFDVWKRHRMILSSPYVDSLKGHLYEAMAEELCAMLFNVQGMLLEVLKVLDRIREGNQVSPASEGLDPLEAEEQTAPAHNPAYEYHEDGDYFTPKVECVSPGCACSPRVKPSCRLRCGEAGV